MSVISVCGNVLRSNNKRGWVNPDPAIRVGKTKSSSGENVKRFHSVGIVDKDGVLVAEIVSTIDGKPVIKSGAKVGVFTKYDVVELGNED
jgi:hypothetical protein